MDEWEELFAKASGAQHGTVQEAASHRKTSRKRKHDGGPYQLFLGSRWEVEFVWPMTSQYFHLSGSFDQLCSKFRAKDGYQCGQCSKPAYEHTMYLSTNAHTIWWLEMICDLWNIRSASKSIALCLVGGRKIDWKIYNNTLLKSQQSLKTPRAGNGELESLELYVNDLLAQIETFLQDKRISKSSPCDLFSGAVKQIMLSDKIYYQLYYLQLTKTIPVRENFVLPHPTEYFASACFDVGALRQVEMAAKTAELRIIGWDSSYTQGEKELHPLLALHWYRRIEGTALFRKCIRINSPDASQIRLWNSPLILSSLDNDCDDKLSDHETLAPLLLKEWRDSCRDFLCHLYAYATLNRSSIEKIRPFLESMKCSGITEIGAGTGYLAHLLQKNGIQVRAYDIAPNGFEGRESTANEYHGHTPSFARVEPCKTAIDFGKGQALLLCYPPPDSLMARDTLKQFLAQGGRAVIHIGEWKGLTGTREFENLLLQNMNLVDRIACPSWGTDASEISFWEWKKNSSLLIPCSNCSMKEAIKRCRLLRCLNYCSVECCRAHRSTRDLLFGLLMIDSSMVDVDFEKDSIFQKLAVSI